MSADNWAVCPKCKIRIDKERDELIQKVSSAYGKIPAEEYLILKSQLNDYVEYPRELREDYEQGIDEYGEYGVNYRGRCCHQECGFVFKYDFSVEVEL